MKQIHPKWFLCALLALAGLGIVLVLPAYRFGGLFLVLAAALIPAYHFLKSPFPRRILTGFLAVLFVMLSITGGTIARSARGNLSGGTDLLIVLGCQVNGTEPSRMLRQRLDAAVELLNAHPETTCIVTGGKGDGENLSEAACMYNYLVAAGIDPSRLSMEDRATSTIENLRYTLEILQSQGGVPERITILSSEFHLYRAGQMAADLGMEVSLAPASTEYPLLLASYSLREILAVWKYKLLGG